MFNHETYPNLTALFDYLDVPTAASEMSFSVTLPALGLEWAGTNLGALFAQPTNLARPRFLGMLADIARFNRAARRRVAAVDARGRPAESGGTAASESLGEFLERGRYGRAFREWYLLPMAGAIWSCPTATMLGYPFATFARFCANHGLLQITNRPQWYTVHGGARCYVERLAAGITEVRCASPVAGVRATSAGVLVRSDRGTERFDQVVLACHSDQARALIDAPSPALASILERIRYQSNRAVLHTDADLMPTRRRAWAAWNYQAAQNGAGDAAVGVTYWLNRLQPLPVEDPVMVTLNPVREPRPESVIAEFDYAHPIFDRAAIAAQRELAAVQGDNGLWLCGAWTGYGFHEDGLKSGLAVANALGEFAPWQTRPSIEIAHPSRRFPLITTEPLPVLARSAT